MAPDKIYVAESHIIGQRGCVDQMWTEHRRSDPAITSVEYIRKDALLEWAKEQKKFWEQSVNEAKTDKWHDFNLGRVDFANTLIDKINQL